LIRIKDLKGKAAELQRVVSYEAVFEQIDENEVVPSIEDSLEELAAVSAELAILKSKIARTNVASGAVDKIHEMESLRSLVSKLEGLAQNKQTKTILKTINYGDQPVKVATHATYDVETWSKKVSELRDRIRELDVELQKLNWEVDLVD